MMQWQSSAVLAIGWNDLGHEVNAATTHVTRYNNQPASSQIEAGN